MIVKDNQTGITLVEVIASIVIITIILTSFLSFFISTAKTTSTSNDIFDATYYAQKEMEHIYQLSQTTKYDDRVSEITHIPPDTKEENKKYYYQGSNTSFEKLGNLEADPNNQYYYSLTCIPKSYTLTTIVVKVYDKKGGVLKAQMENALEWRDNKWNVPTKQE
ncbi:prepilin-type N-terminal cleavage/methylation domain-containing protein [Lysinibacillus capsici]|uniref:prepilin-type N-terminal cleavage/methylation domain-containing protein n=1 Tax=Lysinibacillus capsici TaxID=2115968 RepID=UPI00308215C6|nr:prepilin-type N-terminal cleavage/methylation domain-containing protein [Lysinibacillus capsici]